MSLVSQTLIKTLRRQIEKHGSVVWYDPDQAYVDLLDRLKPSSVAGAATYRYRPERGFIWLRHELEPHWQANDPPRLLIYVPLDQQASEHALVEFEAAGAVLRPGMQPPEQNTDLAVIARQALQQVFPPAAVEAMVSQVEAGQLSLAELDRQTEKGIEGQAGVINAIFDTGNATEVALRFLSDSSLDEEIAERQALGGIANLMSEALGVPFNPDQGAQALRAQLARHVLLTDLLAALAEDTPAALQTIPLAESDVARQAAVQLAHTWRNRLDLIESYGQWAGQIQAEIGLTSLAIPLNALARSQTFAAGEHMLQASVEEALAQHPSANLVELAQHRMSGFWSAQDPLVKIRWEVIWDAGRVLLEATRIENALRSKKWTAETLLARYAYGEERSHPWCLLDTAQRHLERDFHRFDIDYERHQALARLVAVARRRYAHVAGHLAELFTHAFEQQQFELPQVMLQADLFHQAVSPVIQAGRVAVILVDALRFEMARELLSLLADEWQAQLGLALATPPTITDVGMAALMPGAEKGVTLSEAGGRLVPVINGQKLKTRADRIEHFQRVIGQEQTAVTKLDQLAPLANNRLAGHLKQARVILVTASEEIDGLCETNPPLARRLMDDVFNQLRRGIKTLLTLGINTVIIAADHGYLFGEAITPGDAIDAPGGQTAILKRRVWLGKGGAALPGVLRQPLSAFGINGDLELVTPYNLACFKVPGGSLSYFHGGLSLPEVVIPLLTVRAGVQPAATPGATIDWSLTPGSKAITTRFVTVTISGHTQELLTLQPSAVRLEIRVGNQPVSVPVAATYGFQETTKDVALRQSADDPRTIAPDTVTLQVTEDIAVNHVTIHLLDATTGATLSRLDNVPVNIVL